MDQESEGTSVVIFVVCGVVVLLLLLGGGAFFFLMSSRGLSDAAPIDEPPTVEVHEEGPIHVGPGANDEPIRTPKQPIEGPKGPPAPPK